MFICTKRERTVSKTSRRSSDLKKVWPVTTSIAYKLQWQLNISTLVLVFRGVQSSLFCYRTTVDTTHFAQIHKNYTHVYHKADYHWHASSSRNFIKSHNKLSKEGMVGQVTYVDQLKVKVFIEQT